MHLSLKQVVAWPDGRHGVTLQIKYSHNSTFTDMFKLS